VRVITTDLRLARSRGNVLLRHGEANLPEPSVVNVSQIATIDLGQLGRRIGELSGERVAEVVGGLLAVITPVR
jgi:mRNA interferase MazF